MKTQGFIGRKQELAILKRFLKRSIASLLVVKGRRRIGKSRLIDEFCKNERHYIFAGVAPTSKTTQQSQLDEFSGQLGLAFGLSGLNSDNWNTLFWLLAQQTQVGRVVIVLDEISWMGSEDPDFLGKLKNAWDLHFKKNPELVLVLCGSQSAWIDKNILLGTGFVGRISHTLSLEELSLSECNEFWNHQRDHFSSYDKFKILSVTGGFPKYLEEIEPQYSAEENIRNLCFTRGSFLAKKFKQIFSDLFGKRSEKYRKIVHLLVQGNLDYGDICERLGVQKSGWVSEHLNDLVLSGFISRDHT